MSTCSSAAGSWYTRRAFTKCVAAVSVSPKPRCMRENVCVHAYGRTRECLRVNRTVNCHTATHTHTHTDKHTRTHANVRAALFSIEKSSKTASANEASIKCTNLTAWPLGQRPLC